MKEPEHWRERWDGRVEDRVFCITAELFLDDLEMVFRKWGLCLSHEDGQGGFIIQRFNERDVQWVREAQLGEDYPFESKKLSEDQS